MVNDPPKLGTPLGYPGQAFLYTINVTNAGTIAAANVEIVDRIPQERMTQTQAQAVDFLSATQGGQYEQGAVHWRFTNVPPGATRTVQITLRINQPGMLENVVEVQADQTQPEKAEFLTCIVDPKNRLTLFLSKPRSPLEVGRETVYTVRVINSGNLPVDNVALTVDGSKNVAFLKATGPTAESEERGVAAASFQFGPHDDAYGPAISGICISSR